MAVKSKPQVFVAGDGEEFSNEAEAERHDALVKATSDYERARKTLGRATADTQKTADGKLFDFRRWGDYWYVSRWGNYGPGLVRVHFYYDSTVRLEDGKVHVMPYGEKHDYDINELYADEANARVALIAAICEHIAEKQDEIRKLETSVR